MTENKRANFSFDFVSKFSIAIVFSSLVLLGAALMIYSKGINYGVDFRGGAEIQVLFNQKVTDTDLRQTISQTGFSASQVQRIGEAGSNEFLIKVPASDDDINKVTDQISSALNNTFADKGVDIRKTDIVGPKAGEQLRLSGFQAMAWALLAIMIYIALRFDFKYAPGAIVALFHDVFIIMGIFALLDKEFSLQIVGALLAVIGYSVNDTVVVYDRVRELEDKSKSLKTSINNALNQTLTRTLLTSTTTLIVAVTMFLMGGGVIHDFFFAITLGVLVGTYSSVFIAAPTVLFMNRFMPVEDAPV